MRFLFTLLCCLWIGNLQAADDPVTVKEDKKTTIQILPSIQDAYNLAEFDCKSQSEGDRPFLRYIWEDSGDSNDVKSSSFTVNVPSRSTNVARPVPLGQEKLILSRIDLRWYAPRVGDLAEWLRFWEDFQTDPRFNLLITKGTLKFAVETLPNWKGKAWVRRVKEDGFTWQNEDIILAEIKNIDLIRIPDPSLDQKVFQSLSVMTNSQAPVVLGDYFLSRMLTTIKDKGVFAQIYGGRYYEFADIRTGSKKGTDIDNLFEQLGLGSVEKGDTFRKILDRLRSDARGALFRSQVTGNPRLWEIFRTPTAHATLATGLVSFTHDLKDQEVDVDTHPLANLRNFKADAFEGIWERPNGLHGYGTFDGDEKRTDEVPPDVARDTTIPSPYPTRLQSAYSCMSCHEADGSDGWKELKNDVHFLLHKMRRFDLIGDTTVKEEAISDTNDFLLSKYRGNPNSKALLRARDDYSSAVLLCTGPWKQLDKTGQTDIVKLVASEVVKRYRRYRYDLVDSRKALRELGVQVEHPLIAVQLLEELLKPEEKAGVEVIGVGTVIPEDFRIGALKAGLSISRYDWDLVSSFARNRSKPNLYKFLTERKNEKN